MALKFPVLAAGIGVLVQAVSALGGGLVALIPKLTDTLGVAGAIPAAFLGMGLAAATAKLAFSGLGAALQGTSGAMKKLTPQAREFVNTLKDLRPLGKSLKASAQAGLFPGLTAGLEQLRTGAPTARRLLGGMGTALGDVAEQGAQRFTTKGFLADLEALGKQGTWMIRRLGDALFNVIDALRNVGMAARPFTTWLTNTIVGWTEGAKAASEMGRKTGDLRHYFDRTRDSLERFGSILSNLWGTMKGIGQAARPLGEDLWRSADRATARWDRFANSLAGQNELRNYFDGLKDSLHAIFRFVGELTGAFVRIGAAGGMVDTAEALTKAVRPLEHLFSTLASKWGPLLAETLGQLIRLVDNLFAKGSWSGLISVVQAFNTLLSVVNTLLEKIPGLNILLTGFLGVVAVRKVATQVGVLATEWGLVATNAGRAAVAQRAATMGGMASPGLRGGVPGTVGGGVAGGVGARAPLFGRSGRIYNTTVAPPRYGGPPGQEPPAPGSEAQAQPGDSPGERWVVCGRLVASRVRRWPSSRRWMR